MVTTIINLGSSYGKIDAKLDKYLPSFARPTPSIYFSAVPVFPAKLTDSFFRFFAVPLRTTSLKASRIKIAISSSKIFFLVTSSSNLIFGSII